MITTKVLDNGVSFKDDKLKNIVITAFDKCDFIQMIGRKRVDIDNPQEVTVFIQAKDKQTFNGFLNQNINKKIDGIDKFASDSTEGIKNFFNDREYNSMMFGLVYYDGVGIDYNKLARKKLSRQSGFCEYIMKQFDAEDGEAAFIKSQLKWIGLEGTYDENNWIDAEDRIEKQRINNEIIETEKENIRNLVSKYYESGEPLDKSEQQKFQEEFVKNLIGLKKSKIFPFNVSDTPQIRIINSCLEVLEIPYRVSSYVKKGTFWIFIPDEEFDAQELQNRKTKDNDARLNSNRVFLKRGDEIIHQGDFNVGGKGTKDEPIVIKAKLETEYW